jgi:hypothetical protein
MKTESFRHYHIVFYPVADQWLLHCYNIEAKNMLEAIKIHYKKFPDIEPLYVVLKS